MFDIYLTGEVVPESDGHAVYGKIKVGDYAETFVSSLVCWTAADYQRQWLEACERLVGGESVSALIVSYVNPALSEFLVWWPLYRDGDVVHVQNELLIYEQVPTPFVVEDPWSSVRERLIANDDGMEISEWDTQIQSIRDFLRRGWKDG